MGPQNTKGNIAVYPGKHILHSRLPDGVAIRREKRHENACIVLPNGTANINEINVFTLMKGRRTQISLKKNASGNFEIPNTGYLEMRNLVSQKKSSEKKANANLRRQLKALKKAA